MPDTNTHPEQESLRGQFLKLVSQEHCQPCCDGNGTYPESDVDGQPYPAQCEYCYLVRFAAADNFMHLIEQDRERTKATAGFEELNSLLKEWYGIPGTDEINRPDEDDWLGCALYERVAVLTHQKEDKTDE